MQERRKWWKERLKVVLTCGESGKKGRGKEGEVVESGRKVTNFLLPSGYLLLLPKSSGVG